MDGIKYQFVSHSEEETSAFGAKLGRLLPLNSVVCLFGDLGAGKTTMIKGMAQPLANISAEAINSPTYTYLNIYQGPTTVYHFDLYRLQSADEFIQMGFDDFFVMGGICILEWSERIEPLLPKNVIRVTLIHEGMNQRIITVCGDSMTPLLRELNGT